MKFNHKIKILRKKLKKNKKAQKHLEHAANPNPYDFAVIRCRVKALSDIMEGVKRKKYRIIR